ncbi:anti-sigma factor antagonist [Leptospira ryugenii]|uniref:Anti-sigma factor antagonist n=1 Tax=Leptospira ryugenii TaxID=1917863 RepID=A0A2P2E364_9LEPT|nr:STAS domain-containing protein [Leptospira ryugenii]GBF51274.1 anti-sigma factor antagonist [Leptospira ryugenii]
MSEQWDEYTVESGEFKMEVIESYMSTMPNSAIVFNITGEINLYNSQAIRETLERLLSQGRVHFFLVLEEVRYIDSSGLGVFLGVHSKLSKTQGFLRLISPSEKVRYVLELTKLKNLLQIFDSVEDAAKSF